MGISVSQHIKASREQVWNVITDIDGCVDRISGIKAVEVLERPDQGVVGLKWRETREMFGKEAAEVMWISDARQPDWYVTTAKSHGSIYNTKLELNEQDGGTTLTMSFKATPQTFGAKVMSLMSFMFNGSLKKMIQQDLKDIRDAAEAMT